VDLILVRRGEKVTVDVPVTVTGEIVSGGVLDQQLVQVTVEAEATNIPRGIEVDVDGMNVGDSVHASDLKLPRGVTLQVDPETLVLHVIAPAAAEAEVGEAEAGEAAATAAAGGAAAAEASAESPAEA
jgi:large subunit ribosomal protein L25